MAAKLKKVREWLTSTLGGQIILAAVYAAMLIAVLIFFTGNGQFLYEL